MGFGTGYWTQMRGLGVWVRLLDSEEGLGVWVRLYDSGEGLWGLAHVSKYVGGGGYSDGPISIEIWSCAHNNEPWGCYSDRTE